MQNRTVGEFECGTWGELPQMLLLELTRHDATQIGAAIQLFLVLRGVGALFHV
jgi:hypothetical protein